MGGEWAKITDDSNTLFGKSPSEMIKNCADFVAYRKTLTNTEAIKAAYVEFYLSLSE